MKKLSLVIAGLIIGVSTLLFVPSVSAAIDTTPDCDTVAIIRCGAYSESELRADARVGDVPTVFANFGISNNELNGFVNGVVWRDGRVTLGTNGEGRLVATNAVTAGRWNNPTPDMTRIPNTDRAYRMSTSHFVDEGQIAFIKMVNDKFSFAVIKTCGNPVTGNPTAPPPPPTPAYKCVSLVKEKVDRDTYKFTATATASNGAKIVKYRFTFGDGKQVETTSRTVTHTYDKPGNYNIRVTVIVDVNGKLVEDTSAACATQVTIEQPPAVPEYSCKSMDLTPLGDRRVRAVAQHTATGGAVFQNYNFDFGDGTPVVPSTNGTVEHTFAKDGTYTVRVHVVVKVNNETKTVTSEECAKPITFSPTAPPVTPPPTTVQPAKDIPEALVDTGPGTVIGAVVSTMAGGTIAYRLIWVRRYA